MKKTSINNQNSPKRLSANNGNENNANNGIGNVMIKNDNNNTVKASAFKPTVARTPQDKAHNFKNWKDSELS